METLLAGEQLFAKLAALLGHLVHHRVEPADQLGQRLGLRLERRVGLLALVGERESAQHAGDPAVEQLADLQALAPAERGDQAEHGRGGDAGNRGAEGDAEALDRCGQRGTDGVQVGGALQRQHGAVQGDDHAEKGAEHAEQDQQADEVGRDGGAGQSDALAFDAQTHGVLQRSRHLLQPFADVVDAVRNIAEHPGQRRRVAVEAPHFERTEHVNRGDDAGDGKRQRTAADVADGDPGDGGEAE